MTHDDVLKFRSNQLTEEAAGEFIPTDLALLHARYVSDPDFARMVDALRLILRGTGMTGYDLDVAAELAEHLESIELETQPS